MATDRGMPILAAAAMTVLVVAAMALTGPITAPVTCAVFLIAVAWPLQRALQRRVPAALAVVLTVLATLIFAGLLAAMVAWGFSRVAAWVIANGARLQEIFLAQTAGSRRGVSSSRR